MLEHDEVSPHNQPQYLQAIRERIENPDPIAMAYVEEAVHAWKSGLYRASAVMLGGAFERLVLLLAGRMAASHASEATRIGRDLGKPVIGISKLFTRVRNSLRELHGDGTLPGDVDESERSITGVFEHARRLRNKTGHPTGAIVTYEKALAGLLLFPGFYDDVQNLIDAM